MAEQPGPPGKHEEKSSTPQKAAAPEKAAVQEKIEPKSEAAAKDNEKIEALEQRVHELEGRSNGVKWIAAAAIIALLCGVAAIVCAVALTRPKPPPKVLQAEGIELTDPQGRYRTEIGQNGAGWGLFLFDRSADAAGAEKGTVAAPARIELRLADGNNRLIVRGLPPFKSSVDLGVSKIGWPCATLYDKESAARRAELGETEIPSEGKLEKRAPDSVVLSDKQGNPIWKSGETATDFAPVSPGTAAAQSAGSN